MKRLYDFIYCDDAILTRDIIFYHVRVGVSQRDQAAARFVSSMARDERFFFKLHSIETQNFIDHCAVSLFPNRSLVQAVALQRRRVVEVVWLAKFLRRSPPALLNSLSIPTGKPLL